jgi:ribonuclease PH
MQGVTRQDGRLFDQLRPLNIQYDAYGYADASVLLEQGGTIVLASITLQQGVPPFLKGQRVGWLNAEYAMLPAATHQRTSRESTQHARNARSVEISRLIGRCLRPTVELDAIGEKTIVVDCDVLQADGGTRVASITAASLALKLAAQRWVEHRVFEKNIFKEQIAAISTGVIQGAVCLDLAYQEDSQADADFNFVMTRSGLLVEVQGTCEKSPLAWASFDQLKALATQGIQDIFTTIDAQQQTGFCDSVQGATSVQSPVTSRDQGVTTSGKPPLFSLGNRLKNPS